MKLRIVLIVLSILLIAVPIAIVFITGRGLGEITANILVSASISTLIATTLIGLDKRQKAKYYTKIGISIGLLLVLISLWI